MENFNSKQDFRSCVQKITVALKPYYSEPKAVLKYGVHSSLAEEKTQCMEAFIRPLWGLAPLWGGGGECEDFDQIYLQGIQNGTDPEHPEYWGELKSFAQEVCEAPALALALVMAPHKLWTPLSDKQKANVVNWLLKINEVQHVDNNWNYFPVLVNIALKKLGQPYSQKVIDEKLEKIEGFYRGDGWYSDGKGQRFEYYIAFALHFYSLIYAKLMETDDPERSRLFKERAMLFAKHYIYWFDEEGREIPFGRSLTYRFAHLAFWSACLFADVEPYPVEVIKGIIARNLRFWMKMPIFDNSGILTVGYGYNQPHMAEEYTCFGSPNWCMKTFLLLMLPDEHPFWKAKEAPLPRLDAVHIIKPAAMVVQRINGYSCLLPTGQDGGLANHADEKYSKFLYSSKYAFSIAGSYKNIAAAGGDNMLMFEHKGHYFVRRNCIEFYLNDDASVYSKWSPFDGVTVETLIIPTATGHIRRHTVVADDEYIAYDCGFQAFEDSGDVKGDGEKVSIKTLPNLNLYDPRCLGMKAIKYRINKGETKLETEVIYPE